MSITRALFSVVAALVLLGFADKRLIAQECGSAESAFAEPPTGTDSIIVTVEGGRPGFKVIASIDSNGRALFLRDDGQAEQIRTAMLSASLFLRLVAQAYSAAESDRMQADRQYDTTTLQGLLEAVRAGAVAGCLRHLDGVDRHVRLFVDGQETNYECVGIALGEFNSYVFDIVSDAVDEAGEIICQ